MFLENTQTHMDSATKADDFLHLPSYKFACNNNFEKSNSLKIHEHHAID